MQSICLVAGAGGPRDRGEPAAPELRGDRVEGNDAGLAPAESLVSSAAQVAATPRGT